MIDSNDPPHWTWEYQIREDLRELTGRIEELEKEKNALWQRLVKLEVTVFYRAGFYGLAAAAIPVSIAIAIELLRH